MIHESDFRAAWWLSNPHAQTLWPRLMRRRPQVALRRERVELDDGDFIDLDWTTTPSDTSQPIVLVLHGLEGNSASPYAQGLLRAIMGRGWLGVVMHFRGCSGEPNRLPRSYHSGETGDTADMIRRLQERNAGRPLLAIGYSLGGNVLLKYLGERGARAGLRAAVAVSVPLLLGDSADRLDQGLSRIYQYALIRSLKQKAEQKFARMASPIAPHRLSTSRGFRDFDNWITAPLHGFKDAEDYYRRSSSRQYLQAIEVPTLLIQAADDPFLTPAVLPRAEELSAHVRLEISAKGGHVGFVGGSLPGYAHYWLESRIPAFLAEHTG